MSIFKETIFQDVLRYAISDTLFAKIALWTTANQVEFSDGKNAEDKLGKINGITNNTTGLDTSLALSQKGARTLRYTFENVNVAKTNWVSDNTYTDYPYKATIICPNVDSTYIPYVTFSVEDVLSGVFAPVAKTDSGKVYIYASEIPSTIITIPTIQCIKS